MDNVNFKNFNSPYDNLIGLEIVPYIVFGLIIFYLIVVIPILIIRDRNAKKITGDLYFESKIQYYTISLVGIILFFVLYLLNINNDSKEIFLLFGTIALTAFIFVSLYSISKIKLTDDEFVYIKL